MSTSSINALEFYKKICYLLELSKRGISDASVGVGTLSTILIPNKHLSNYEQDTASKFVLCCLEELPAHFFEKPLFYPFSQAQLDQIKDRCWSEDSEGKRIERVLIKFYEKVLQNKKK